MAVERDDRTTTDNRRHEHGLLLLAFNQISNNAGMLRIPPAATSKFPW